MANKKIYYLDYNDGHFGDQLLYREGDLYHKSFVYSKCPVFNHKANRTFVAFSPIDFTIKVDKKNQLILSDNNNYIICDQEHLMSPLPVIQLNFPRFLFWTKESNIWFEYKTHPMTSLNNNFIGVEGWFNLSNWYRNSSNAFTIVDEKKPVVIKKGDPMFRVSFIPPNFDDGIILKKIDDKNKVSEILEKYNSRDNKKSNWKSKLFSKTKIQTCPFKFLHKSDV